MALRELLDQTESSGSNHLLELGQYFCAKEVQGSHDLVVGRVTGLHHDQELVDPQVGPAFDVTAYRVNVTPEHEAILNQLIV